MIDRDESTLEQAERRLLARFDEVNDWLKMPIPADECAMHTAQLVEIRSAIAEIRRQMAGDIELEPKPKKAKAKTAPKKARKKRDV